MRGIRVVGCALVVVLLAACGSGDSTKARRDAVNRYLTGVQNAQVEFMGRQGQIDSALQAFSLSQPSAREVRSLRLAHTTIVTTLRRVRALDAPPDARRLDRLLVRRLVVQQQLVDELIQTSADVSRLTAAAPRLSAAAARLRADLAARAVPAGGSAATLARYGAAFGRYGDALRPLSPRLAPVQARSLLGPTLEAQSDALRRSVALCDTIRRDLAKPDVPAANRAIHDLLTIAASLGGEALSKREAAVAATYDAKVADVNRLAIAIGKERERLVRVIG